MNIENHDWYPEPQEYRQPKRVKKDKGPISALTAVLIICTVILIAILILYLLTARL